jgi:hypothetical protein
VKRLAILLVVLVCIPIAMAAWDVVRATSLRSKAVELCQLPNKRLETEPYLKGKLAVIDVREGAWEPLLGGHLPPDLVPLRAEELGTCALLEWAAEVDAGTAVDPRSGKPITEPRANCKVTLIDLAEQAVIAEKVVFASAPAPGFAAANSKPVNEVEDWLFRLPRR